MNAAVTCAPARPWYRVLNRRQWNTLIVANLGWLFDGYETYALILTAGLIAFLGPLVAGTLITYFGGFGRAAVIVSMIYILGIVAARFFPETRGKPLPE